MPVPPHVYLHPTEETSGRPKGHSLALGGLLGCDLVSLLPAHLKVMAAHDGARLRGRLWVPERDFTVQCGHRQLLAVWPVGDSQA